MRVLRLDKTGFPVAWISVEEAVTLAVRDQIIWSLGDNIITMRGGYNCSGLRSIIKLPTILACDGDVEKTKLTPSLTNRTLFRRDDHYCMYCGNKFSDKTLTRDHVIPISQGGANKWNNVVAACQRCNNHKGGRTPEQANMELLAVPFTPNIYEFMYLSNRQIIGDQMEYLKARFKTNNRRWQQVA